MNVSILVPYRNRKENLFILLTQIRRNLFFFKAKLEVIIVDLGSEENIAGPLQRFPFVSYTYLDYKGPFSRSWALNIAFRKSNYPWLFILDADCFFTEKFLVHIEQQIDENQKMRFYIFGAIRALDETLSRLILSNGNITNPIKAILAEYFQKFYNLKGMGNQLLHREIYEAVTGFDEKMIGWGREDSDFCDRLMLFGAQKQMLPESLDHALFHLFHTRDQHHYCSPFFLAQNDCIETFNRQHHIHVANTTWGWEHITPDQYRYESLFNFDVVFTPLPLLKVNSFFFNNPEDPQDWQREFLPAEYLIDPIDTVVLLGGGLNYACKAFIEKSYRVIIIEKYKTIKELACQWNCIEPRHFLDNDFTTFQQQLETIQQINHKLILSHQPSFNLDRPWYAEVYHRISSPSVG